jgi:hypothetical protein
VQLLVYAVLVVSESNLTVSLYRFVHGFDIVKKRFIFRFAPVGQRIYVLYARFEIPPSQLNELSNQIFGMDFVYMPVAQHRIYEQAELPLFEYLICYITALPRRHYV